MAHPNRSCVEARRVAFCARVSTGPFGELCRAWQTFAPRLVGADKASQRETTLVLDVISAIGKHRFRERWHEFLSIDDPKERERFTQREEYNR